MVLSLRDYRPSPRYDGQAWTDAIIEGSEILAGVYTEIDTVTFDDPDLDPTNPKDRSFTVEAVPSNIKYLRVTFQDDDDNTEVTDPVAIAPSVGAFSTLRDVRLRVGHDLTEDEIAQAQALLVSATVSIYGTLNMPSSWTPTVGLDFLGLMCTELVARTLGNPLDLFSKSETIGGYSYTQSFARRDKPGLLLSDAEALAVRRVVFGTTSGSVTVRSFADDYADNIWPLSVSYGLYYQTGVDPIQWI